MASQLINIPASGISKIGSSLYRLQLRGSDAVAIDRSLRNGDAARYFGRLQFVTTGTTLALRVGSSASTATSSSRQDLSDAFETNGFIIIKQGVRQLALNIAGLDTSEPYSYNLTGNILTQARTFFNNLDTSQSATIELFDERPVVRYPLNVDFSGTGSAVFEPDLVHSGIQQIRPVFNGTGQSSFVAAIEYAGLIVIRPEIVRGRGTATFSVSIVGEVVDLTRRVVDAGVLFPTGRGSATWAESIPPASVFVIENTMVGWAVDIAGIGLGRSPFRLWSGQGQLTLNGKTYEGTTFDGGALASISPVENSIGDPSSRAVVSIAVPNAAIRSMLNIDVGPVWVEVFNIYSIDGGLSWTKLRTGIAGRLSRPNFDVEGSVYTVEIETWSGDADRGRPKLWSDESQKAEYPNDRGMEFLREYESGVEIKWPP